MDPVTTAPPFSPRLPPELCDLIIDALVDDRDQKTGLLPESTHRALRNCTLVCHSWNPRARLHLRAWIHIEDVDSLANLAQRMGATPGTIAPHVSLLVIYLPSDGRYPPSNVLTLLPILFRLGLSSINYLSLYIFPRHDVHQSQPREAEQETMSFPHLSLHPRFSSLVTPVFSTVRGFSMCDMTFKNFSDFGKFLNCFPRLEELFCQDVQWLTLGVVPGCMSRKTGRTFLPNLRQLHVRAHFPIFPHHTHTESRILALYHPCL